MAQLSGVYRECSTYYRSGPKKGRCRKYRVITGAAKPRRRPKKRWCIRWSRSKPKRCIRFGTKREAQKAGLAGYYTVRIPYEPPERATPWHPTEPTGPFKVLTRGAFKTRKEASEWARENLRTKHYSIRYIR